MKQTIYHLVEKGSHGNRANKLFDYFILSLIVLCAISISLETVPEISKKYGAFLSYFNTFSIIIFSLEYLLRLYISDLTHPSDSRVKSLFKFVFSFYGLIDLLAILPFYIPMLIKVDLRFIRILRLTRVLRILKMNRYSKSLLLIWEVIKEKKSELLVSTFMTLLILIVSSFLMFYLEKDQQPEVFSTIFDAFWWAIATLTTVGYGDMYPVTGLGRLISGFIAFLGIGIVALPTGIIGAGFVNKIENNNKNHTHPDTIKCPHCGSEFNA